MTFTYQGTQVIEFCLYAFFDINSVICQEHFWQGMDVIPSQAQPSDGVPL